MKNSHKRLNSRFDLAEEKKSVKLVGGRINQDYMKKREKIKLRKKK